MIDDPKFSKEAEEALVGSRLIDPSVTSDPEVSLVKPEHFYIERLKWTWQAMDDAGSANQFIDHITVADQLENAGRLMDVGGSAFLAGLVNVPPTHMHAREYARIVRGDAIDRKTLWLLSNIAKTSNNGK